MSEAERAPALSIGRAALAMAPALALLPASYAFPAIDLEGPLALAAYVLSESGGVYGLPWVAGLMTGVIASAPGLRRSWALIVLLVSLLLLGGISAVNEFWTKRRFAVPRPNIVELGRIGTLGLSPEDFYSEPDKDKRREALGLILARQDAGLPRLHPWIRAHWQHEAGFSFPSGHSLAAFLFATIFAGIGVSRTRRWRRLLILGLVPWAAALAFSRVLLRVHSPTDILVGASLGLGLGLFGLWLLARAPGAEAAE